MASFSDVDQFESNVAEFFGAPYGVATDSCTHAIELCLRLKAIKHTTCPAFTYVSIPMMLINLGIEFTWDTIYWKDYYSFGSTNIIDAAAYWKRDGYVPNSMMCLSFQYKKHLSLGRGGIILCSDANEKTELVKMSYDGRMRHIPWEEQKINSIGFHYYMTPEIAVEGLAKLDEAKRKIGSKWDYSKYPDLRKMPVFEPKKRFKH